MAGFLSGVGRALCGAGAAGGGGGAPAPTAAAGEGARVRGVVEFEVGAEFLVRLAREAGAAIMEVYARGAGGEGAEAKGDGSPLTEADTRANAVICAGLARACPHVPIVSEETRAAPWEVRRGYQYCFVVDPLDGTKEFLKRNGQFTVNIALVRGTRAVLGVVHAPASGETWWAAEGQGAWRRRGGDQDERLFCREFSEADAGLSVVGSASHASPATAAFLERLREPEMTTMGSSLKFMLVAEGRAHIYPRLAPTCEWDTAASQIVVEEAGGCVLQAGLCGPKGEALEQWQDVLPRGRPVEYNKQNLLNPFFVVYGKRRAGEAEQAEEVGRAET